MVTTWYQHDCPEGCATPGHVFKFIAPQNGNDNYVTMPPLLCPQTLVEIRVMRREQTP